LRPFAWWRRFTNRLLQRPPGPLLDLSNLIAQGERMLDRAGERPVTLLVFDFEELAELRKLYGDTIRRTALQQVGAALQSLASGRGLAARTGPAQFALLLRNCTRDEAMVTVMGALGTPCRFELEADGGEVILVPDVLAGECSRQPGGIGALHRSLSSRLLEGRRQRKLRELHLRRTRERYSSRPSSLDPR
jgi:hypothetical protein